MPGAGRAGDEDEATRLVAQAPDDRRQSQSVEALDFPWNGPEHRSDGAALVENVAAEARQVLQAEREIQLEVFLEAVLLCIREHAVGEGLGVRSGQRRHIERTQTPVDAHARSAVGGDMQVAASHFNHLLQAVRLVLYQP